VRRKANTIHAKQGPGFMHRISDCPDIVNRPEDVRYMSTSNELDLGRKQRLQVLGRELQLGFVRMPPDNLELEPLGHEKPGLDICFVLHLGQDNFIALVELQSIGEVHEKLCR
jgi:hypothetical protein